MQKKIQNCRICNSKELVTVLDLGKQKLTGIFPKNREDYLTDGPVELLKCSNSNGCGLVQIAHQYDLSELYGENYGYRSGLNKSMVLHLENKVKRIISLVELKKDDLVIDIGSNDCTTLKFYSPDLSLVGIDPSGGKFLRYYPEHVKLIEDFFSADILSQELAKRKAKVITSFSMFYDLEKPIEFMEEIKMSLDDEGIWIFEQSYMPFMLEKNSYDTVCQEHIEYYTLKQIKWMCDKVGFKIIDIEFNDINGGSFSVTVAKLESSHVEDTERINKILKEENDNGLDTEKPWIDFQRRIDTAKKDLLTFLNKCKEENKTVFGLGASTKGNVLLQYCGISEEHIIAIGEVNSDKYGCYTPGTLIPIISETEVLNANPDYILVFPWHFKDFFLSNLKLKNMKLVFPLPNVEIIKC